MEHTATTDFAKLLFLLHDSKITLEGALEKHEYT